MRILIALGGNAMTGPGGSSRVEDQQRAIAEAMESVADLVTAGHEIVLTHGNGPQVGNVLLKNELAAEFVPPVPLDWCGAQTQATIAFTIANALDVALEQRGSNVHTAGLVSRTLVADDDPKLSDPTKPIGRYVGRDEAELMIQHGQRWKDFGQKGWRRVVASPEPVECLEMAATCALLEAGYVVVCSGGGGIPTVRRDGQLLGREAVIDKDLTAALLGAQIGAELLVIATDVDAAVVGYGTPEARPLGETTVVELRSLADQGHFGAGSMGPKVEAVCRFAERTRKTGVITSLHRIAAAIDGAAGTRVAMT